MRLHQELIGSLSEMETSSRMLSALCDMQKTRQTGKSLGAAGSFGEVPLLCSLRSSLNLLMRTWGSREGREHVQGHNAHK